MATILCDLDGTLLRRSASAWQDRPTPKRAALNAALSELAGGRAVDYRHGIEDGLTDWLICERALRTVAPEAVLDADAWRQVVARAEALLAPPPAGSSPVYAPLPGVPGVLDALRAAGHTLGLATGNLAVFALHKLQQAGIDRGLFTGPVGFGDHGRERAQILRTAVARAGAPADGGAEGPLVVLGDTRHDRAAAAAVGLPFLGVGTTGLRAGDVDARPDSPAAFLDDLADADAVLAGVARVTGRRAP